MIVEIQSDRFAEVTATLAAAARKAVEKPTKAQRAEAEADGLTWEAVARYRREDLFHLVGGNRAYVSPEVFDKLGDDNGVTVLVADEADLNPLPDPEPQPVTTPVTPEFRTLEMDLDRRSAESDTPPPVTDAPDTEAVAETAKTARATPRPRSNK